jgi:hypothetical protein
VGLAERPENLWQPLKVTRGGSSILRPVPPDFRALNAPQNDFLSRPAMMTLPKNEVTRGKFSPQNFPDLFLKKAFDKLSSQAIFTFIRPNLAPIG